MGGRRGGDYIIPYQLHDKLLLLNKLKCPLKYGFFPGLATIDESLALVSHSP